MAGALRFRPRRCLPVAPENAKTGLMATQLDNDAYADAVAYLYQRINYERTADTAPYPFRLRRMRALLDHFDLAGVAGQSIPVVHIAGTKGKGSTATMVAEMLSAAGLRTGLYTSPHLLRLEERFTVNGQLPTADEVVALVQMLRPECDRMAASDLGEVTFFELTTALALLHFRKSRCDAVVLEVGLGGRLDSTNVCFPAVTAITSIGLDHQHILGHSLAEIAWQKAGILKPGVPLVSAVADSEPRNVIAAVAREKHVPLFAIGDAWDVNLSEPTGAAAIHDSWEMKFDFQSRRDPLRMRTGWQLPLDGEHQCRNAAVACAIVDLLAPRVAIELAVQRTALANISIPTRIERFRLGNDRDLILDASHNVDSIDALCRCVSRRAKNRPVMIVFGTSRDKDFRPMLDRLAEVADHLVLTRYHANPRYREPTELLAAMPTGVTAEIDEQPIDAVQRAIRRVTGPHLVVICGSFFLAAEILPTLT